MSKIIKICKIHGETEFNRNKRKDRLGYIEQCIKCNTEKVNKLRKELKQKAIEYKGGCCSICGYNRCNQALDFHHLDPDIKEADISNYKSWNKMKPELDKCILVCRNCHSKLHFNEDCNNYDTILARRNKIERINYKGGCCAICKNVNNQSSLDFHHLDPRVKEFSMGGKIINLNNIKDELNKTILLCANCHSEYHAGQIFDLYHLDNPSFEIIEWKELKETRCIDCNVLINKNTLRCPDCHNKYITRNIPDREIVLNKLIELNWNMVQTGKAFSVSDNAVRKWIKKYNIIRI